MRTKQRGQRYFWGWTWLRKADNQLRVWSGKRRQSTNQIEHRELSSGSGMIAPVCQSLIHGIAAAIIIVSIPRRSCSVDAGVFVRSYKDTINPVTDLPNRRT